MTEANKQRTRLRLNMHAPRRTGQPVEIVVKLSSIVLGSCLCFCGTASLRFDSLIERFWYAECLPSNMWVREWNKKNRHPSANKRRKRNTRACERCSAPVRGRESRARETLRSVIQSFIPNVNGKKNKTKATNARAKLPYFRLKYVRHACEPFHFETLQFREALAKRHRSEADRNDEKSRRLKMAN